MTLSPIIKSIEDHPTVAFIVGAIVTALLVFAALTFRDAWQHQQVIKQNQHLEKSINASEKAAAESETNANADRETRLEAEGRAAKAQEEKQQAAANSNRTADPVRKARQRYEETRRSRPADSPTLGDEQLCAELTKRDIACR